MKIGEYERGYNDASGEIIAWLHDEALTMNDTHARGILNGAAFALGLKRNTVEAKARVVQQAGHGEGMTGKQP